MRTRFLAALASSGLIAAAATACGGSTDEDGGSGGSGGSAGTAGSGGSTGGSGGSTGGSGGSTGGTGGVAGSPQCDYGTPAEQCFTLKELEAQLNNPPMGGDVIGDGGVDAWMTVSECLPPEMVQDGCCNPAAYGPKKDGELCCYVFCTGGCCGRAFVVDGAARVANVALRSDWLASALPDVELDAATRAALADAWLEDARMEHASIASFARFTLELLGHGAPPELVAGSQQASLDEIEHARLCFSLASRFGGAPVGPGVLDPGGALASRSLAECAVAAFEEGCIGETIAALSARAQLAHASDPEVRSTLETIAADEERHAELAWRFVAWAVKTGGDPVRRALDASLSAALGKPRAGSARRVLPGVDASAWRRFGRLTEAELFEVARAALADVVVPCARAALGASHAALPAVA